MFAARRLALRAAPRRGLATKRDPKVERAVKEAAEQNSPLFGSSALTLDNPWLWVAVARRAVTDGSARACLGGLTPPLLASAGRACACRGYKDLGCYLSIPLLCGKEMRTRTKGTHPL